MKSDVFISYVYAKRQIWSTFVDELIANNISVFQDYRTVETFESITARVKDGLASSKIFLALWTPDYSTRRACQWELTTAYLNSQNAGETVSDRILVITSDDVDPNSVILPELRDSLIGTLSDGSQLVARVTAKLSEARSEFGPAVDGWPQWYPNSMKPLRPPRFVGRCRELWKLHAELNGSCSSLVTNQHAGDHAQVVGPPGIGKSFLVLEYAIQFRAAYPGGVLWYRLDGDIGKALQGWVNLMLQIADELGLQEIDETNVTTKVKSAFRERQLRMLWVIDDVPSSMSVSDLRTLFAPSEIGATVITTRALTYSRAIGGTVPVTSLDPTESIELLTGPENNTHDLPSADGKAINEIADKLGHHPLALAVVGAFLSLNAAASYNSFLQSLEKPDEDSLQKAELMLERLNLQLPTGHELSITAALLQSIENLSVGAKSILVLASQLASAPIPVELLRSAYARQPISIQSEEFEFGLIECQNACLVDGSRGMVDVHDLLARTVRYHLDKNRETTCRLIDQVLEDLLTANMKSREIIGLRELVPHLLQRVTQSESNQTSFYIVAGLTCHTLSLTKDCVRIHEHAASLVDPTHPDYLRALDTLASAYKDAGKIDRAYEIHSHTLLAELESREFKVTGVKTFLGNIASTCLVYGDNKKSSELLELRDRVSDPEPIRHVVDMLHSITDAVIESRPIDMKEALGHPTSLEIAAEITRGQSLEMSVGPQAALDHLQATRNQAAGLLPEDDNAVLSIEHEIGRLLNRLERFDDALEVNQRVYSTRKNLLGEEHGDTCKTGQNLGVTLGELGQLEAAAAIYYEVLQQKAKRLPAERESFELSVFSYAHAMLKSGSASTAADNIEKILTRLQPGQEGLIPAVLVDCKIGFIEDANNADQVVRSYIRNSISDPDVDGRIVKFMNYLANSFKSRFDERDYFMSMMRVHEAILCELSANNKYDINQGELGAAIGFALVVLMDKVGRLVDIDGIMYVTRTYFGNDLTWMNKIRHLMETK